MIFATAYSPDGRMIASSGTDSVIRLWDVETGALLKSFSGHSILVMCTTFSPDGKVIATSSVDQTVRLWDVSTGECLRILEGHSGQIGSVAFSSDGRLLASASADETIVLWEPGSGALLKTLRAPQLCEGMNITGITGLRESQILTLKVLGAFDSPAKPI
jgi:WD40 repeat protein